MTFNEWFCSLPEGRQAVLRDDKWMLAQSAFDAALTAEREACAVRDAKAREVVKALVAYIEKEHRMDQHNPYTVRELHPKLFAAADEFMRSNAEVRGDAPLYGAASLSTDGLCDEDRT